MMVSLASTVMVAPALVKVVAARSWVKLFMKAAPGKARTQQACAAAATLLGLFSGGMGSVLTAHVSGLAARPSSEPALSIVRGKILDIL